MKYVATVNNRSFPISVDRDKEFFAVLIDGKKHTLDFRSSTGSSLHSMIVEGKQYEVVIEKSETGLLIYINGEAHHVQISRELKVRAKKESKVRIEVRAAMPGLVVALEVKPGQSVKKDDGLLVMEAMKMQNEVKAPKDGIVAEVHARKGSPVEKGEKLVTIQT